MRLFFSFFTCFVIGGLLAQEPCGTPLSVQASAIIDKGREAHKQNKLDSAVYYYQQAKLAYTSQGCYTGAARAATNLALIYSLTKDAAAYQVEIKEALLLAEKKLATTDTIAAKIYQIVGTDYYKSQANDTALLYLNASKNIYLENKSWHSYIRLCRSIAILAQAASDFKLMEENIKEAYDINEKQLKNPDVEANLLQLYGALYYRIGAYGDALLAMQKGLALAQTKLKTKEDTLTLINYYNNIGLLYSELGDLVKAQDYELNALALCTKMQDFYRVGMIHYNLAESFKIREDYTNAYFEYKKGLQNLALAKETNSEITRLYINLHNGLAEVAPQINKADQAAAALKKNLALHQKEKYRFEETQRILGLQYLKNKETKLAQQAFYTSLNTCVQIYGEAHPLVARAYQHISDVAYAYGDLPQALAFLETAQRALFASPPTADINVLPSNEAISDPETYLRVLYSRAAILYELNRKTEALNLIEQAVQLVDRLRNSIKTEGSKIFVQKKVMPIYELRIKLAYESYQANPTAPKDINRAFYIMEKSKGLLLLNALQSEQARNAGDIPKSLLREDSRLQNELARVAKLLFEAQNPRNDSAIAQYQRQLLALREEYQQFQTKLEADYPRYFQLKYKEQITQLPELCKQLSPNAQLVEYFIGNDHIYILTATQKETRLHQIPKTTQLDNQIVALRTALTNSQLILENTKAAYYLYTQNAYAIYQACLESFIDTTKSQLIIIPDGLLNYIPFEALINRPIPLNETHISYNFKTLPYLLHKYTVHYNYSASLMLFGHKASQARSNGQVLALAPTYKYQKPENPSPEELRQAAIRSHVKELPGAKFELLILEKYFNGHFYTDSAATERQFKTEILHHNYSILHLAMHGWVDNNRPEYSSLILTHSRDSAEDNMLHAYELPLLNIPADMVVLSACETGFGRFDRGEGVVSIGRGFMHAGASSLVMTLWSINDQATAILMTNFYSELGRKMPKDRALQLAKINYIEKADSITSHPFFWAAFVLVGDPEPIHISRRLTTTEYLLYGGAIALVSVVAGAYFFRRRRA